MKIRKKKSWSTWTFASLKHNLYYHWWGLAYTLLFVDLNKRVSIRIFMDLRFAMLKKYCWCVVSQNTIKKINEVKGI